MTSKIEISHKTIIFTVFFLIGLWFLVQISDILLLIFIAFILMSALRPLVDRLEWLRLPRAISILLIYAVAFGIFGVSLAGIIPSIIVQSTKLIAELPNFIARVLPYWNIDVNSITQQIAPIGENLVKVTLGLFSNLVTTLTILVFTFYFLLERRNTEIFMSGMLGSDLAKRVLEVVRKVEQRLGAWLLGQLFLMFIVGVMVFVGLNFLHVEFTLALAIFAGLLEIVPMVGPIVSAIPAVIVALASSPLLALSVVALYFIVQQLENHFIVPLVMKKSVGLSPLITIFSLMVWGRLAGITGAVLAVPTVLVLQAVIGAFLAKPTIKE